MVIKKFDWKEFRSIVGKNIHCLEDYIKESGYDYSNSNLIIKISNLQGSRKDYFDIIFLEYNKKGQLEKVNKRISLNKFIDYLDDKGLEISTSIEYDNNIGKYYHFKVYEDRVVRYQSSYSTKNQARAAAVLASMFLRTKEIFDEFERDGKNHFEDLITFKKGTLAEYCFDLVLERIWKSNPDIQKSYLKNKASGSHNNDGQIINNKTRQAFFFDVKSKAFRDQFFLDQGINEKHYQNYSQVTTADKFILIFIDQSGGPDFKKTNYGDFDYANKIFSYEDTDLRKGMLYGNFLNRLIEKRKLRFKSKKRECIESYPHKGQCSKSKENIIYFPLTAMMPITKIIEEIFDIPPLDFNLNYIPEEINILLTAYTTKR
jgi:hypothetical protein